VIFHDDDLSFKLGVSVTRGNSCEPVKTSCNTNAAKYFYTNRIVLAWNSLSDTVVTASSVNAFRQQLNTVNLKTFLIVGQLLSRRVLVALWPFAGSIMC